MVSVLVFDPLTFKLLEFHTVSKLIPSVSTSFLKYILEACTSIEKQPYITSNINS